MRPSILVEKGKTRILVDSPPDLREQLLAARVSTLSAVVYTHAHADHLHGIDDLRSINRAMNAPLNAFADRKTLNEIRERFAYTLAPLNPGASFYYKPTLIPQPIGDGDVFWIDDIQVTAFEQNHGFSTTLGFRFSQVAYTTDVVELPERVFAGLQGISLWIIGVLVDQPHPTHCDVDKALTWINRVQPERAVLTHLGNDLDYDELASRLPDGVEPAFDGMIIDVADELK